MRDTYLPNNRLASNKDMYGVLLLAMNSSDPDSASAAADLLDSVQSSYSTSGWSALGTAAVSRLVMAAATRQHIATVLRMTSSQEVLQQLDACTFQAVLFSLIKSNNSFDLAMCLRKASTAQQLSTNAVMELLQAAVQSECCVEPLCEVPAAQQLRSDEVLQLLQAAVAKNNTSITRRLFRLPAAQQFDGDMWAQLLETAIRKGTSANKSSLFKMQPVQQLTPSLVARLLEVAIEHDDAAAMAQLLSLESAQQLTLSSLQRLAVAALQRGPDRYSWWLFRVPVAAQLTADEIIALAVTAAKQGKKGWGKRLCELPAAHQLVAKAALAFIKHGSEDSSSLECAWLRALPAFQLVSSDAVFELLQAAVGKGSGAAQHIAAICELSAAKQLSSESLGQLLLAAGEQHGQQHISSTFALPIAQLASESASGDHGSAVI
jgi:hypothetical protein